MKHHTYSLISVNQQNAAKGWQVPWHVTSKTPFPFALHLIRFSREADSAQSGCSPVKPVAAAAFCLQLPLALLETTPQALFLLSRLCPQRLLCMSCTPLNTLTCVQHVI